MYGFKNMGIDTNYTAKTISITLTENLLLGGSQMCQTYCKIVSGQNKSWLIASEVLNLH